MYKRRARLLVAAERPDGRAVRVAELAAAAEFEDWIEVRPARAMAEVTDADMAWADLLVAVDTAAARVMPAHRPATCRPKYWQLPGETGADFDLQTLEALRCMVGGMRMLARVDAEDDA